jgi:hypothetical protein
VRIHFTESCGLVDRDYARIFEILAANETLESFALDVDGVQGREWTRSLQGVFRRNRTLKVLKLSEVPNEVAEEILKISFSGLQGNDSLRELSVEPTGGPVAMSEDLVKSLLHLLRADGAQRESNLVFHTLGGRVSFPSNVGASAEARFLLKQNRFGRRSVLAGGPASSSIGGSHVDDTLPRGVWPHVLQNVAANRAARDVMYHFLKVLSSADGAAARRGVDGSEPRKRARGGGGGGEDDDDGGGGIGGRRFRQGRNERQDNPSNNSVS